MRLSLPIARCTSSWRGWSHVQGHQLNLSLYYCLLYSQPFNRFFYFCSNACSLGTFQMSAGIKCFINKEHNFILNMYLFQIYCSCFLIFKTFAKHCRGKKWYQHSIKCTLVLFFLQKLSEFLLSIFFAEHFTLANVMR